MTTSRNERSTKHHPANPIRTGSPPSKTLRSADPGIASNAERRGRHCLLRLRRARAHAEFTMADGDNGSANLQQRETLRTNFAQMAYESNAPSTDFHPGHPRRGFHPATTEQESCLETNIGVVPSASQLDSQPPARQRPPNGCHPAVLHAGPHIQYPTSVPKFVPEALRSHNEGRDTRRGTRATAKERTDHNAMVARGIALSKTAGGTDANNKLELHA